MAFRYLIYSTGTTYTGTIKRESATNNPSSLEASLYTDFLIPEIQPLYLWQVIGGTTVVPNTDSNVLLYEGAIAPPVQPTDSITYGEVTGMTSSKIDKVTGGTIGHVTVLTADGSVADGGYTIPQLTGLTTYTFTGSGGTTVSVNGNAIKITSTVPTGTTVSWGDIVGSIPAQTDLWNNLTWLSGATANKLATDVFTGYTASTASILGNVFTGATNAGSGTTLISSIIANSLNLKSIKVVGGLTLTGDGSNIVISGQTNTPSTWGQISGTLSDQTDLYDTLTGMTGQTATKLDTTVFTNYSGATKTLINSKVTKVTGATTNDIVTFGVGGEVQDSGKQFTTTVQGTGVATNNSVPTELAVRNAINSAIAAAIILQGDWNATTNSPDLTVTGITTGYAWRISVSGATSLGGITNWKVGDLAVKSASGWIKIDNEDIAAIWGNIVGNIADQTDLQAILNAKVNITTFSGYTGTTKIAIDSKLAIATFSGYTGTTKTQVDSKLAITTFTGYTASTKNVGKKIQVVWTGTTTNANVVIPLEVPWQIKDPYATDMYLFSGGTGVWILSSGMYEVQYHFTLKNDASNQTHSLGAYVIKNGVTLPITAGAGMVVGVNASGEISVPPAVLTLAVNDRLDLAVFRVGSSGNANLVSGSVFMTLNKLT